MNRAMTPTDWSLLLAAALLLGSTFLFLNIAVAEISPLTAAAARTLIAAPLCWALMRAFGVHMPRTGQEWIALFWLGLLTAAIPFGTIAWGQQHIESGLAGILFGTMPIMSVVLAPLFLAEETFTRRRLAGALVGLAGVVLVIGPSVLANAGDQVLGIAITFLAPLSHTLGAIYARRHPHLAPPAMATGQMIFGAAILTPLAFLAEAPFSLTPSMGAIGAILVTGVACTAAAMSLYFVVVRRIGVTRSSLMPLFMPVVAVLLGAAVLGERLPVEAFFGLALILAGALAVVGRAPAKPSLQASPARQGEAEPAKFEAP
jgi:drug/metabolite transporter (DMT)-like permease